MKFIKRLFHHCLCLELSCKGISGLILKCKDCGRRYAIKWDDYKKIKDVLSNKLPSKMEEQ